MLNQDWSGCIWAGNANNKPRSSVGHGFCIAMNNARIFFDYNLDRIYFNCRANNAWQGWHKITTTYNAGEDGGYG